MTAQPSNASAPSEIEELWYDTRPGLTKALERGLTGLLEIFKGRHENYGNRRSRLRDWCLLGRYHLDSVGNCGLISEGAPADESSYEKRKKILPVMSMEEIRDVLGDTLRMTVVGFWAPQLTSVCDRCLGGWDLDSAHDVSWDREHARPRHRVCNELAVIQDAMSEIREIVAASGIVGHQILFVPNRYWPSHATYDGVRTPWAIVHTERGPFRIGWRKNVIEIEWSFPDSKFSATGTDVAAGDATTTQRQLVHAWGREKAIEYVRRLWDAGVVR